MQPYGPIRLGKDFFIFTINQHSATSDNELVTDTDPTLKTQVL